MTSRVAPTTTPDIRTPSNRDARSSLSQHRRECIAEGAARQGGDDGSPSAITGYDLSFIPVRAHPTVGPGRVRMSGEEIGVGAPADAAEHEADRVADAIAKSGGWATSEGMTGLPVVASTPARARTLTPANGRPLEPHSRNVMQRALGRDLTNVRIHTDDGAAAVARRLGATAFTVGSDIGFQAGAYDPSSTLGRRLLAHELTHVVQQEHQPQVSRAVVQRAECSLGHLDKECADAAAACSSKAADFCAAHYPTPSDIEAKWTKVDKLARDQQGELPNASANLLHFLGASGAERTMPTEVFRTHKVTKEALIRHRARFIDGARRRLEKGTVKPGALSEELVWTDTASAFNLQKDDLGLAVGGFTLCSKVRFVAHSTGGEQYQVEFSGWSVQAFDCYNWDPGKGIGVGEITDNDMCCLENASRGKHFRVRTEPWSNDDAASLAPATISAVVPVVPADQKGAGTVGGAQGGGEVPPSPSPSFGDRARKFFLGR